LLKILNGEKSFSTAYIHLGVIRVIWASVLCNLDQSRAWLMNLIWTKPSFSVKV